MIISIAVNIFLIAVVIYLIVSLTAERELAAMKEHAHQVDLMLLKLKQHDFNADVIRQMAKDICGRCFLHPHQWEDAVIGCIEQTLRRIESEKIN